MKAAVQFTSEVYSLIICFSVIRFLDGGFKGGEVICVYFPISVIDNFVKIALMYSLSAQKGDQKGD